MKSGRARTSSYTRSSWLRKGWAVDTCGRQYPETARRRKDRHGALGYASPGPHARSDLLGDLGLEVEHIVPEPLGPDDADLCVGRGVIDSCGQTQAGAEPLVAANDDPASTAWTASGTTVLNPRLARATRTDETVPGDQDAA